MRGVNTDGWSVTMTRRLNVTVHNHEFTCTLGTHTMADGCVFVVFDPKGHTLIPHGPLPHTVAS